MLRPGCTVREAPRPGAGGAAPAHGAGRRSGGRERAEGRRTSRAWQRPPRVRPACPSPWMSRSLPACRPGAGGPPCHFRDRAGQQVRTITKEPRGDSWKAMPLSRKDGSAKGRGRMEGRHAVPGGGRRMSDRGRIRRPVFRPTEWPRPRLSASRVFCPSCSPRGSAGQAGHRRNSLPSLPDVWRMARPHAAQRDG